MVPDSCCKTVVAHCGQRDHASNIYKVEVGGRGLGAGVATPWGGAWSCGSGGLKDLPAISAPIPTLPGRLHHQAGDLHPGAPESHRGRGHRHRLCAGAGRGAGRAVAGAGHTRCLTVVPTRALSTPQVFGMIFTCCLYKSLKLEHY